MSQRYYQHYLGIINSPGDQPQASAIPALEAMPPSGGPDGSAAVDPATGAPPEAFLAESEELTGLSEVAPIQLTAPAPPKPAPDLKSSEKAAKKKFCFIATAAYGSPLAPEVVLLQNFRDTYLSRSALGEKFIRAYYRSSPSLAAWIRHNAAGRFFTRCLLTPLIWIIKKTT